LLQCCNASVQSVGPLAENRFQSVNADFVQKFSDSRKKFIGRLELLSLEVVFEKPKQETRKRRKEPSPASPMDVVDVMQFVRNCHGKTPLSLLLYVALHCPHGRSISFHLSLNFTQTNDLADNIST
jgi:hypothetical protein